MGRHRYQITIIQRGERCTVELGLPPETERQRAKRRAREVLMDHPPGTEVAVRRFQKGAAESEGHVEFHAQIDDRRRISVHVDSDARRARRG
jgi:hypothetical protein